MRRIGSALLGSAFVLLSAGAMAQSYASAPQDPCQRTPFKLNFLGMYVPPPPNPERDAACQEERRQQWSSYLAHQQAEQARQQAALVQQERQQAAHERLVERAALIRRHQAYDEQLAAETSPENQCRQPDFARAMMENWSDLDSFKEQDVKAVDIEHLTTTDHDPVAQSVSCHGVFMTNKGLNIVGTFSRRNNVAGDPIWSWHPDEFQDRSRYEQPPPIPAEEPTVVSPPSNIVPAAQMTNSPSSSFDDGLADRKKWEGWYGALAGEVKDGATWWASNRSLPLHGQCSDKSDASADWAKGCEDARQMLSAFDMRRMNDATYKKGWNSL